MLEIGIYTHGEILPRQVARGLLCDNFLIAMVVEIPHAVRLLRYVASPKEKLGLDIVTFWVMSLSGYRLEGYLEVDSGMELRTSGSAWPLTRLPRESTCSHPTMSDSDVHGTLRQANDVVARKPILITQSISQSSDEHGYADLLWIFQRCFTATSGPVFGCLATSRPVTI